MHPPRIRIVPLATTCHSCLLLRLRPPPLLPLTLVRPSTSASQGRANKGAQGPGKRLGAKKAASELVVPGNIIFRQRGTHWYPGENCAMGRDHTIFAKEKGYVTYYRDPETHPKRKYIGIVFQRGEKLPVPRNEPRRRRLGLVGKERELSTVATDPPTTAENQNSEVGDLVNAQKILKSQIMVARWKLPTTKNVELRPGYQYRESNWSIGRTAEQANVKVREYKRGDRFLAWRKLNARKARNAERRALGSRQNKGKGKKR
ncbi:hypothetical protein N7G274_006566 [Stereocaulon virgatum]|uniref:Large ribosomal subunit protein bL27m n=1 Tax=Stereocaulon virgatum TaxID=373712 RepID=A0ABR4A3U4_9LECA